MSALHRLTREIDRVVSSHYAVSLQNLHDTLRQCDAAIIRAWALGSLCQVTPLARCVKEALRTWPYALRILQKLAQAPPFRNAFLQQDPTLLDAFLRKATTPDCPGDVFETCVVLLSEPLPDSVPLPSSAQTFFMQIFEKATRSTDKRNVTTVYVLLDGACRELLGVLPYKQLDYFEEQSYKLLKIKDRTMQLLCLGLLIPLVQPRSRRIALSAASSDDMPFSYPDHSTPMRTLDEIPRVFRGSAALATLNLVTMLCIEICRTDVRDADEDATRSLKIASEFLTTMPLEVRRTYVQQHPEYSNKLVDKVLKLGSHPTIQLQAMAYIGLLYEGKTIPEPLVSAYSKAVLTSRKAPANSRAFAEALSLSLPCYAEQLKEEFVKDTLRCCMEATVEPSFHFGELQWLTLLVELLGEVAQESKAARKGLLLALTADDFQGQLRSFIGFSPRNFAAPDINGGVCSRDVLDARRRLGLGTCSLLLKSALAAQTDELGIDVQTGLKLLKKQQELAAQLPRCGHAYQVQQLGPSLSLVQETCTPRSQPDSHDWRQRLTKELENHERDRIELIERRVSEVCRDLETRCENVEEPLRNEQQKTLKLQENIGNLQKQNRELSDHASELEIREFDRDLCMESLEAEKFQVEVELKRACEANDELSEKLEELQRMLREAKQSAQQTLSAACDDYERSLTELRIQIATTDMKYDEQSQTLDLMLSRIAKVEEELSSARQETLREQEAHTLLKKRLIGALHDLEEQKTAKLQAQAEVNDLAEKESALAGELEHVNAALIDANSRATNFKMEHETLVASLNGQINALLCQSEEELRRTREETSKTQETLEAQLQKTKQEIEELVIKQTAKSEKLQARDAFIAKLQHKIEALSEAVATAEANLEEVQAVRDRIWSAMGVSEDIVNQLMKIAPQHSRNRAIPATPRHHTQGRRRTFQDTDMASDVDYYDDQPESEGSQCLESAASDRGGPTPKRSKPHRQQPFKAPTLKPTTAGMPESKRRSARLSQGKMATGKREPLKDVSAERGNLSPVRRPTAGSGKNVLFDDVKDVHAGRAVEQVDDVGALSFDASELLAGTPFTPSGGQRRQQVDDEETNEL